jgi:hypothetical protein
MKFKPGDMVVFINHPDMQNDFSRDMIGRVGTVNGPCLHSLCKNRTACYDLDMRSFVYRGVRYRKCHGAEYVLRLVPPYEGCDEDFDWRRVGEEETA